MKYRVKLIGITWETDELDMDAPHLPNDFETEVEADDVSQAAEMAVDEAFETHEWLVSSVIDEEITPL